MLMKEKLHFIFDNIKLMIWHYLVRYLYKGVFHDFSSKGVATLPGMPYLSACKNGVLSKGVQFQKAIPETIKY